MYLVLRRPWSECQDRSTRLSTLLLLCVSLELVVLQQTQFHMPASAQAAFGCLIRAYAAQSECLYLNAERDALQTQSIFCQQPRSEDDEDNMNM